ncbi:hypothetical protein LCGC14_2300380 [marine sediment metagenome]|uniref:Uncharacterized protein n=1 Tax=marine sediment metagenome TaxID=412755 RepID=A0A0F9F127_9ZZZZ
MTEKSKVKSETLRRKRIISLLNMGKSYRDIQDILGVSIRSSSRVNRAIGNSSPEYKKVVYQITNLLKDDVCIEDISELSGTNLEFIVLIKNSIAEKKYMEDLFKGCYTAYGLDPEFDKIYRMFWRDFSLGTMKIGKSDKGKFQVSYTFFSEKVMGLKTHIFSNEKLFMKGLVDLYSNGNKTFLLGDYSPKKIVKGKSGPSKLRPEMIHVKILKNGKFSLSYPDPKSILYGHIDFDDIIEIICSTKKELINRISDLVGKECSVEFPKTPKLLGGPKAFKDIKDLKKKKK